ncbi:hypothetical protein D3C80_1760480 [compost metagenome]
MSQCGSSGFFQGEVAAQVAGERHAADQGDEQAGSHIGLWAAKPGLELGEDTEAERLVDEMSCAFRAGHSQHDENALEDLAVVPAVKHLFDDAGGEVLLGPPQATPIGAAGLHHLDEELVLPAVVAIDQ